MFPFEDGKTPPATASRVPRPRRGGQRGAGRHCSPLRSAAGNSHTCFLWEFKCLPVSSDGSRGASPERASTFLSRPLWLCCGHLPTVPTRRAPVAVTPIHPPCRQLFTGLQWGGLKRLHVQDRHCQRKETGVFANGFNNLPVALAGSFRPVSHILQRPFP